MNVIHPLGEMTNSLQITNQLFADYFMIQSHSQGDPRHVSLRGKFETKKQLFDAVKLVALEQGKSMMVNPKKKGGNWVVLGCTDTLAKGANGNCSASVSGTKLSMVFQSSQ